MCAVLPAFPATGPSPPTSSSKAFVEVFQYLFMQVRRFSFLQPDQRLKRRGSFLPTEPRARYHK